MAMIVLLLQCNHGESVVHDDIVSSCFTPVSEYVLTDQPFCSLNFRCPFFDDANGFSYSVLPRDMMDIDLQLVEVYNLSSEQLEEERDIRCHRQLKVDQSSATILHPLNENTIYTYGVENSENPQKPAEPLVLDMILLSNAEACPSSIKENAIATHPTKTHNGDPLQCDLGWYFIQRIL